MIKTLFGFFPPAYIILNSDLHSHKVVLLVPHSFISNSAVNIRFSLNFDRLHYYTYINKISLGQLYVCTHSTFASCLVENIMGCLAQLRQTFVSSEDLATSLKLMLKVKEKQTHLFRSIPLDLNTWHLWWGDTKR